MSSFEYVMVIVSIIMGLGITSLLKGTVVAMRRESPFKPGLLHGLWVVNVLVQHVLLWSLRWDGVRREEWPGFVLFVFLLLPITYYALAELLFPDEGRQIELTDYFIQNRKPFFSLFALSYVFGAVGPFVFYEGVDPTGTIGDGDALVVVPLYGVLVAVSLLMARTESRRAHGVWAVISLALSIGALGGLGVG
jgi:hypothetical protein